MLLKVIAFLLISTINANPVSVGSSTWKYLVEQSPLPSFILFSSPNCGHCKNFKPIWSSISDHLKNHFMVGSVDCSSADGNALCSKYNIKGVPAVKMFYKDPVSSETVTLEPKVERTVDAMVSYAKRYQPSSIYRLMEDGGSSKSDKKSLIISFKDWISLSQNKKMVLFIKGSSSSSSSSSSFTSVIRPTPPSMAMNTLGNLYQTSISLSIVHRDQPGIFKKVIGNLKGNEDLPAKGDLLLLIDNSSYTIKANSGDGSLKFQELKDLLSSISSGSNGGGVDGEVAYDKKDL